eukprot:g299.t1
MPPRPSTGQRHSEVLTSGCTSRVGRSPRGRISVALPRLRRTGASGGDEGLLEEVVLLQPVVQPGVAASVGFASLSVAKLLDLIQAAQGGPGAMEDLRSSLSAAFSSPGGTKGRCGLGVMHMVNAAFEGLSLWANDHDEAASLIHRDQLRGLAALLLSPVLVDPGKPQPYEVMCRIMRLVAWMPAEGRRELQELLIDDCSEEEVLRSLVSRVRLHCDETVLRAHQMQRLSPEIWEGLMLLQLLWGTNEAIAQRLAKSLRSSEWPEADFGQSLAQTLSQLGKPAASVLGRFTLAPQVRPPVPSSEFHLQSLAEEKELEFRLFVENACAGPITPSEVLELPLYAARTDYGFEYVLPSKMRSFMANQARDKFPALARWATWCYRQASNLQFGDTVLQSSSGVQQGDPLGPLLFAAAIQPLAAELRASAVDLSMFYLDDGVLAGSVEAVASALAHLQRAAADVGLALNLAKCEAITVGMTPAAALGPIAPSLLTASDGSSRVLTDFEFLGAGVGSPLHLETHAAARVDAASKLLHAIGELDDPQVALRLLRASAGYARLVHTMRCCPPAGHESALDRFNHLVQECFSSFTGLHLEAAAWAQATRRGLSQAGLGLRSTKAHAAGAYLASVGASATLCGELDPGYWLDRSGGVAAALSAFNDQLEAGQHLTIDAALRLSQKEFSQRASPKPAQTLGAPSATLSWTRMGTMVGCVLLAVSAPCVTMPCGTWFLHGPNEVAFDPSERKLASCYHSGRMT